MKMKMLIFPWLFSMASFCGLGWTEWRRKNIELSQTDLIEYPKTSRKWMTSTDKCGLTISKGDLSTVGIQDFCWAIAPIFFSSTWWETKKSPLQGLRGLASAGMASHRCLGWRSSSYTLRLDDSPCGIVTLLSTFRLDFQESCKLHLKSKLLRSEQNLASSAVAYKYPIYCFL